MEICVSFTEFLVLITSSMPFAVFFTKRLGFPGLPRVSSESGIGSFLQTNFRATTSALPATF